MKTVSANLDFSVDTFNTAFLNINKLLYFCNTEVLSANASGGSTTGNAILVGTFISTTLVANSALRGGNLTSSNTLTISSNANFAGVVNVAANLNISSISTFIGNTSISGNSTVVVFNVTGNSSISEATLNGTNLKINSNVVANGGASFNNTFAVVGNTSISGNSTVLAFGVTTNSTATNTYIGGILTVNALSTFSKNVTMSGDLTVTGNLNAVIGQPAGDFIPISNTNLSLGNSTLTWTAHLYQPIIYSQITPNANGVLLGNTTNRFAAALSSVNATGIVTFGGNLTVNSTALVIDASNKRIGINTAPAAGDALTVTGTINSTTLVSSSVTVSGNTVSGGLVVGNSVIFANVISTASLSAVVVDSFPKATYPLAKYIISVKDTTTLVHALELLLTHEGTNVLLTKYGEIYNTNLGSFDADINGANVELKYTSSNAGTGPWTIKTSRTNMVT